MMFTNISAYKFVTLSALSALAAEIREKNAQFMLKGTILLSTEGINLNLAGSNQSIQAFKKFIHNDARFSDLTFKESVSATSPFKRFKIKLKSEIITLRDPAVQPQNQRAAAISPQQLKNWLDTQHPLTLVDTRNDYEIRFGTFARALNLQIQHFCTFPEKLSAIPRHLPIVMFCTGGIRCEKAAISLLNAGYESVYQLDGGILNYFAEVGGAHYQGECYVFDERVALDHTLQPTGTQQCIRCQGPIAKSTLLNNEPPLICRDCV